MKCPKCRYLGFDTGDRCRNCGYDFSLLPDSGAETPLDVEPAEPAGWPDLRLRDEAALAASEPLDLSLHVSGSEPAVEAPPVLPLFRDDQEPEDEPLVRVTAPRAPIAVRKTPDPQRLRFPQPVGGNERFHDSVLEFGAEPEPDDAPDSAAEARRSWGIDVAPASAATMAVPVEAGDASPMGARLTAALIDFGLLFGIDAVVIHFTLRLTSLTLADWRLVPLTPLLVFLIGLKLTYLSAFTLAGGQTIGKMATGIRVVGDDDAVPDLSQAVRRAVVEVASLVAAGVPFLLALADPARRGLHDRVAHTRVVALS